MLPFFDSLAFELLLAALVDFLTWLLLRLVLLDVVTDDLELRAGSLLLTVATDLEALLPETADDLLRVAAVLRVAVVVALRVVAELLVAERFAVDLPAAVVLVLLVAEVEAFRLADGFATVL